MTIDLSNKIRQISSFIDESFDLKFIQNYHLTIQVGADGCYAIVHDKEKNKYIAFEHYSFQQVYNPDIISDLFENVSKESKIIPFKYRSVSCSVINNLSTIIPSALYEDDRKKLYLKFNTPLQGDEFILTDDLKNLDAKNIFAIPVSLKGRIDFLFQRVKYHHFSSALIEELLSQNRNQTSRKFYIHIQPSHFEIIIIEGKNLIFYNSFNYHSAEDLVYYVLFVCEQLKMNPESMEAIIIGEIDRSSAIFSLTQKYIRTIRLGERTETYDFSYQLQTFPKHFYFSLFNSYLL